MSQTATPIAHPAPGRYAVSQMVTLTSDTPDATILYTTDGSPPFPDGKTFQPFELIPLDARNQGEQGVNTDYTLRAVAVIDGTPPSEEAVFHYRLERGDQDRYISREMMPGVFMIEDYDSDKMFLVLGTSKALLIDTGFGSGDLRGLVEGLTGGLPLEVVITHAHPDHIARLGQFQPDCPVYLHPADLPMAKRFRENLGMQFELEPLRPLNDGMVFDLGGRQLTVYEVPGHSPGCIVLLDEADGTLFAGDALGSNRPYIVDSLWMQMPGMASMDRYLSTLQVFRARVRGKVQRLFTGHNDEALYGETYLDNLEKAVQQVVDRGEAALLPSFRPSGIWQSTVGERLTDPNWAAINLNKETYLSVPPDQIATLSNLQLDGGRLVEPFQPDHLEYHIIVEPGVQQIGIIPTTASTRTRGLQVSGIPVRSGEGVSLGLPTPAVQITATAPDGVSNKMYILYFN